MVIRCCKGCTERHFLCHNDCIKYLKERAELDKENEHIRKQKEIESRLNNSKQKARLYYARQKYNK